ASVAARIRATPGLRIAKLHKEDGDLLRNEARCAKNHGTRPQRSLYPSRTWTARCGEARRANLALFATLETLAARAGRILRPRGEVGGREGGGTRPCDGSGRCVRAALPYRRAGRASQPLLRFPADLMRGQGRSPVERRRACPPERINPTGKRDKR